MNQKTLIVGRSGRGKTTLLKKLLAERKQFFAVIFDSQHEFENIPLVAIDDVPQMLDSQTSVVRVSNEGAVDESFLILFKLLCKIGSLVPHIREKRILLVCDEFRLVAGQFCDTQALQRQIEICRRSGVDLLVAAHRINHIAPSIREQITEIHHFQTQDPISLKWLAEVSDDPEIVERVKSLPKYEYVTLTDL